MNKILVPIDFSDLSMKAAMYAAAIVVKTKGTLSLLHVVQPPPLTYSDIPIPISALMDQETSEANIRMSRLEQDLVKFNTGLDVKGSVLEGEASSVILEFARLNRCDLIIMGTHGASGFQEFIWGSVTAKMVAVSSVPLLAIPQNYLLNEPKRLLLSTNHFEKDTTIISPVFKLASLFDAEIDVVVFVDKDKAKAADYLEMAKDLERYQRFLQNKFPSARIRSKLLDGTDFESALALYEQQQDINLIAMITYPKDFIEKLTRKTATKKMTMHSAIPVLAIPARKTVADIKPSL